MEARKRMNPATKLPESKVIWKLLKQLYRKTEPVKFQDTRTGKILIKIAKWIFA